VAAGAADGDVEAVEQEHAVRQTGERIVKRLVGQPGRRALALDRVADRAVERIRVGGRVDQEVLDSVADRPQRGQLIVRVSEDDDRDVRGARQDGLERCGRVVVAGRKVEHDAGDLVVAQRAPDARDGVPDEHVGMPAGSLPEPFGERRRPVLGGVYYEQP